MGVPVIGTLPHLAEKINEWFPEVKKRAFAVADSEITKENIPTLPVCMVALLRSPPGRRNGIRTPNAADAIAIEFWWEPVKAKKADGSESPFYVYYDYETLRKRLAAKMATYSGPESDQQFRYAGMDVEATPFAVIIQFVYTTDILICTEDDIADAEEGKMYPDFTICVEFTEGD